MIPAAMPPMSSHMDVGGRSGEEARHIEPKEVMR